MSRPRWSDWRVRAVGLAVLALVFVDWAAYAVQQPLGGDTGVFAWAGLVMRNGGVMYRDVWDIKGPLVYFISAAVVAIAGPTETAFRGFDLLVHVAGTVLVGLIAAGVNRSRRAGVIAGAIYLLWYAGVDYWTSGQADGWAGVLLAVAVLAAMESRHRTPWWRFALAGMTVGLTALIKPTFAGFLLVPAVLAFGAGARGARTWRLLALAAGFAIPVAITAAVFLQEGAAGALIDVHLRYNALAYGGLGQPWFTRVQTFVDFLLRTPLAYAIPLAVAGIGVAARRDRLTAAALTIWLLGAAGGIVVQGKIVWFYQWLPLFAPLAVLAGCGADMALHDGRALMRRSPVLMLAAAAVVMAVGAAAIAPVEILYRWTKHLAARSPRAAYEQQEYGTWGRQPGALHDLASYVRAATRPGDPVLFVGQDGALYFLARRPSATRFVQAQALFDGPDNEFKRRYRAELMRALGRRAPAVITTPDTVVCTPQRVDRYCLSKFPQFEAWLRAHYVSDTVIAGRRVWRPAGR